MKLARGKASPGWKRIAPDRAKCVARFPETRQLDRVMSEKLPESELNEIVEAVSRFPGGARIREIAGTLAKPVPARSLQRRFESLVAQGRLLLEGRGRASRYRLAPGAKPAESAE